MRVVSITSFNDYESLSFFQCKAKATKFFVVRAVGKIISGRLVGKTTTIGSTSKKKNIDHRVKETVITTQVIYETDRISLILDSKISSALNFCIIYFVVT